MYIYNNTYIILIILKYFYTNNKTLTINIIYYTCIDKINIYNNKTLLNYRYAYV